MVKGRKHDNYRELLGEIVRAITQELGIPMSSSGETTWIRPEIERGLEADQSYYFLPEKLAAAGTAKARGSNDVADYPNPDLAIEVDISPPQVDRTEIYAKLQVIESAVRWPDPHNRETGRSGPVSYGRSQSIPEDSVRPGHFLADR